MKNEELNEDTPKTEEKADPSVEETQQEANESCDCGCSKEEAALSETDALNAKLEDTEDQLLRARAEIANMRSRFQKERESLAKYRSQDLGKDILPAIDNLERALAIEVTDEQGASLKKGIEMVLESLNHALKEAGIEEIEAEGAVFDPNLHQAVQTMPKAECQQDDEIIQVLQKGYRLSDRVLRPTMVVVAQ